MAISRLCSRIGKPLLAGLALLGVVLLGGCGGGSGNTGTTLFDPPVPVPAPLLILPAGGTVYGNTPTVFTISGGVPPYRVFSSDTAALPVNQSVSGTQVLVLPAPVNADVDLFFSAQDSRGVTVQVPVKVRPAPLVNGLTVEADRSVTNCGNGAPNAAAGPVVCTGDTGTAAVQVLGPAGTSIPGRQVRFEVIQGDFAFFTNIPAQPLALQVTIVSDQNGRAIARFKANTVAPTAFALVRATELTSGNQVTGAFTVAQVTDGTVTLKVVPDTVTITAAFKGVCSFGFLTDYSVYGGTPPYRITPSFPTAVKITPNPLNVNGGSFRAETTGVCVDPLTFAITDATGRTTTATLINKEGTAEIPVIEPPDLIVSPTAITPPTCSGRTFQFAVVGGTPPYNVSASFPSNSAFGAPVGFQINSGVPNAPQLVQVSGGTFSVTGLVNGSGQVTINVVDSSGTLGGSKQKLTTATITCP